MKISIQTTNKFRPNIGETLGDYWIDDKNTLQIRVSDELNLNQQRCIAIHELVEALLCLERGIDFKEIDEFDNNDTSDEPGNQVEAPYHREHQIASIIELIMAHELGVEV